MTRHHHVISRWFNDDWEGRCPPYSSFNHPNTRDMMMTWWWRNHLIFIIIIMIDSNCVRCMNLKWAPLLQMRPHHWSWNNDNNELWQAGQKYNVVPTTTLYHAHHDEDDDVINSQSLRPNRSVVPITHSFGRRGVMMLRGLARYQLLAKKQETNTLIRIRMGFEKAASPFNWPPYLLLKGLKCRESEVTNPRSSSSLISPLSSLYSPLNYLHHYLCQWSWSSLSAIQSVWMQVGDIFCSSL